MSIDDIIKNSAKGLDIPITAVKYLGNKNTYVVYNEYLQQGGYFSEDGEELTECYYQLNIYSENRTEIEKIRKQIIKNLKAYDFIRESEFEIYDKETNLILRTLRFYFLKESED